MRIATGGLLLLAWPILGVESISVNCTFQSDPDHFLGQQAALSASLYRDTTAVAAKLGGARVKAVAPNQIPRNNFIDVEIFDRLAAEKVQSAPISSDEEFLRRITLDLAGRLPEPNEVRAFLTSTSGDKRGEVINRLLYSPDFVEKWTMWMGDLVGNSSNAPIVNPRGQIGRNAFYNWIRASVANGKSLRDMAYESIVGRGNSQEGLGLSNFSLNGRTNGPAQDTYDMMMVKATSTWLGLGHYDCLVCHDGRRHLDDLSTWGKRVTRLEAYNMAAFFSRTRFAGNNTDGFVVSDVTAGNYTLNTNFGNRPNRTPFGTLNNVNPVYRFGQSRMPNSDWRTSFAEFLVRDPMLSRNLANRLWKAVFGLALVEPVDALDPDRLDPSKPAVTDGKLSPLQASHPRLLEQLAKELEARNFDLREFLKLLTESSAYQLSSRYEGNWNLDYVPLFARHYPRRLEGEEIHDMLHKATGTVTSYTVTGFPEPLTSALRMPEPLEPRTNTAGGLVFMNFFYRGNRDTVLRNQSGSILQQLALMNNTFVTNKVKVAASPVLRSLVAITDNGALADQAYLTFLGRYPTLPEKQAVMAHMARSTTAAARNTAVEDLGWALINQVEYLFSY